MPLQAQAGQIWQLLTRGGIQVKGSAPKVNKLQFVRGVHCAPRPMFGMFCAVRLIYATADRESTLFPLAAPGLLLHEQVLLHWQHSKWHKINRSNHLLAAVDRSSPLKLLNALACQCKNSPPVFMSHGLCMHM